jgi:hypothetical protein
MGQNQCTSRLAARGFVGMGSMGKELVRVQSGGPEAEGAIGCQWVYRQLTPGDTQKQVTDLIPWKRGVVCHGDISLKPTNIRQLQISQHHPSLFRE